MENREIVNIAGYRFVDLDDRDELRQPFRFICEKLNLKGTILLSKNGINFFFLLEKRKPLIRILNSLNLIKDL